RGGQRLTVGAEGDAGDDVAVPLERGTKLSGMGVPEANRLVGAGRRKDVAVGRVGETPDLAVAGGDADGLLFKGGPIQPGRQERLLLGSDWRYGDQDEAKERRDGVARNADHDDLSRSPRRKQGPPLLAPRARTIF